MNYADSILNNNNKNNNKNKNNNNNNNNKNNNKNYKNYNNYNNYVKDLRKIETKVLLNEGYTIIKRNENTKKIEMIVSNNTKILKENLEKKKFYKKMNEMIEKWNIFRENDIEFRGDLSVFINYKEEIDNMVKEDIEIEEMMKESSYDKDYDYSSDEENNKYLLY